MIWRWFKLDRELFFGLCVVPNLSSIFTNLHVRWPDIFWLIIRKDRVRNTACYLNYLSTDGTSANDENCNGRSGKVRAFWFPLWYCFTKLTEACSLPPSQFVSPFSEAYFREKEFLKMWGEFIKWGCRVFWIQLPKIGFNFLFDKRTICVWYISCLETSFPSIINSLVHVKLIFP